MWFFVFHSGSVWKIWPLFRNPESSFRWELAGGSQDWGGLVDCLVGWFFLYRVSACELESINSYVVVSGALIVFIFSLCETWHIHAYIDRWQCFMCCLSQTMKIDYSEGVQGYGGDSETLSNQPSGKRDNWSLGCLFCLKYVTKYFNPLSQAWLRTLIFFL